MLDVELASGKCEGVLERFIFAVGLCLPHFDSSTRLIMHLQGDEIYEIHHTL